MSRIERIIKMGLRKKVFPSISYTEPTKEEQEEFDKLWNVLCEKGSVNVMDPSKPVENIIEIIKQDPNVFTGPHCDFYSDDGISYDEFVERVLAGEYDKT